MIPTAAFLCQMTMRIVWGCVHDRRRVHGQLLLRLLQRPCYEWRSVRYIPSLAHAHAIDACAPQLRRTVSTPRDGAGPSLLQRLATTTFRTRTRPTSIAVAQSAKLVVSTGSTKDCHRVLQPRRRSCAALCQRLVMALGLLFGRIPFVLRVQSVHSSMVQASTAPPLRRRRPRPKR